MLRDNAVNELKKTFAILSEDVEQIRAYGRNNPTPFAHRTLLRTHFAVVEGITFLLRQVALASEDSGLFTPAEISVLREETYHLDKKGEVETCQNFHTLLPSILFTMRCYARLHGARFQPDTSNHGWSCMQRYKKLRDRLTHPKSSVDLELSESELSDAMEAAEWFKRTLLKLFTACEDADEYYRSRQGS